MGSSARAPRPLSRTQNCSHLSFPLVRPPARRVGGRVQDSSLRSRALKPWSSESSCPAPPAPQPLARVPLLRVCEGGSDSPRRLGKGRTETVRCPDPEKGARTPRSLQGALQVPAFLHVPRVGAAHRRVFARGDAGPSLPRRTRQEPVSAGECAAGLGAGSPAPGAGRHPASLPRLHGDLPTERRGSEALTKAVFPKTAKSNRF